MKQEIVLKATGERVHTQKETARLLIEMGRAVTIEDHLAEVEAKKKADAEAAARQTKVITPTKTKRK